MSLAHKYQKYKYKYLQSKKYLDQESTRVGGGDDLDRFLKTYGLRDKRRAFQESCLNKYQIEKLLGKGGYANAFSACLKKDCKYAIKMLHLEDEEDKISFDKEVELSKTMSENDIGPTFYGSKSCNINGTDFGVIVMEKMDTYIKIMDYRKISKNVCDKFGERISKLHQLGYVHGDMKHDNILIKFDPDVPNKVTDIKLVDFGETQLYNNQSVKRYTEIWNYYASQDTHFKRFFTTSHITSPDVIQKVTPIIDWWIFIDICDQQGYKDLAHKYNYSKDANVSVLTMFTKLKINGIIDELSDNFNVKELMFTLGQIIAMQWTFDEYNKINVKVKGKDDELIKRTKYDEMTNLLKTVFDNDANTQIEWSAKATI